MAVPQIQKLRPYDESPAIQSSCHKFCMVIVVSDGLSHSLNFTIFLGEHAPRAPKKLCSIYAHGQQRATRAASIPTLYVCPLFLQSLDPPLITLDNVVVVSLSEYVHVLVARDKYGQNLSISFGRQQVKHTY